MILEAKVPSVSLQVWYIQLRGGLGFRRSQPKGEGSDQCLQMSRRGGGKEWVSQAAS